ncbi:MAG: lytic transglycosylase domain-containing protein [Nitrospiria bacterium]
MLRKISQIAIFGLAMFLWVEGTGRGEIFHFVDGDGIRHFSNVPTDPRFKKLLFTEASLEKRPYLSPGKRSLILRTIEKTAEKFGVEAALIKAVVKVESDFNPMAISSAGAMGLMQLMPSTASRWSVGNPLDPTENVWGGVRHLSYLMDLFDGNLRLSLAAYHAGERLVQQYLDIPPIPATQEYVQRVLKYYKKYQGARAARTVIYKVSMPTGEVIYTDSPDRYWASGRSKSKEFMIR